MFAANLIGLSAKQHAPHADRNKGAIVDLFRRVLPSRGVALEVGSGTGQHIVHFARSFPDIEWQPSDYDQVAVSSIDSYRREARLPNLREPFLLEARRRVWGHGRVDAVLAINLVHATSWSVCEGVFDGARRHLKNGGVFFLCGPFRQRGEFCSESGEQEHAMLRARNPDWGYRDVEVMAAFGMARGLVVEQVGDMPGGDLALVFRARPNN